jgi:hypothetical protein
MNNTTRDLICLLLVILGVICTHVAANQRDTLKQEAVDRGFAEWAVVGQDKIEFKWKEKQ